MQIPKTSFIEKLYQYLPEEDWMEGVDLYQAGHVSGTKTYEGLVSGHVTGMNGQRVDVRLKIHPAGNTIQWIECTCRKNRQHGAYCEHIAAFMIHIDCEQPQLFAKLDAKMPLKPPATIRRTKPAANTPFTESTASDNAQGATQAILSRLEGSIHSAALLGKGPQIRVRIEIKSGQLSTYNLDVDAAAQFLQTHRDSRYLAPELLALNVFKSSVFLTTCLTLEDEETIKIERVIACQDTSRQSFKNGRAVTCNFIPQIGSLTQQTLKILPAKDYLRHTGKQFIFIPGEGYFPLDLTKITPHWQEAPFEQHLSGDKFAPLLLETGFAPLLEQGTLCVDARILEQEMVAAPQLMNVKVISSKDGWFYLDPQYGTGKDSVSFAAMLRAAKENKRKFIRQGKSWLKIPEFVTQFDWQLDQSGESLRVDKMGLMRMKAAAGELDAFVGTKKALAEIRNVTEFEPQDEPPHFQDIGLNLRHYQEVGVKWLWWLFKNNLHGLLADEMGLGKTHQAMGLLALVKSRNKSPKFLIVCPTTVLDHWLDKMVQYAAGLLPEKFHGPKRNFPQPKADGSPFTIITSYGIVLRDIKHLSAIHWDVIILDEAHSIKNSDTVTYKAVCTLRAEMRLCLSGTPLENHLGELKAIFDFLLPGYLGSDEYFRKVFQSPIQTNKNPAAELGLQKLMHPFKMRRTKEQVLPDLPEKVEDFRHCQLSAEQAQLYQEILSLRAQPLLQQLQDEKNPIPYVHVFATLTLLKQVCDHPALVLESGTAKSHESGKFELLKELLDEALGSGHKVVIYSQYLKMIDIISDHLEEGGIEHSVLTGQTRDRAQVIRRFQETPECRVFCASLLAGGIGIDLTAASVVVHYDRWWNASKENQATDRVHRIGQNKNVQVIKMITRGTLEEKIDQLIKNKQSLFEKFLDRDEEVFKTLSRQELIELLQ